MFSDISVLFSPFWSCLVFTKSKSVEEIKDKYQPDLKQPKKNSPKAFKCVFLLGNLVISVVEVQGLFAVSVNTIICG